MADTLSGLRELEVKGTPGDWSIINNQTVIYGGHSWLFVPTKLARVADLELVVAMRNALSALLDVAEAAQAVNDHPGGACGCSSTEARKLRAALATLTEADR